jgi:hypothetical protein
MLPTSQKKTTCDVQKLGQHITKRPPQTTPVLFRHLQTQLMISEFTYNREKGSLKIHLWVVPGMEVDPHSPKTLRWLWEELVEALGTNAVQWTPDVELAHPGAPLHSEANPMGCIKGSVFIGLKVPKSPDFRQLPPQVVNVCQLVLAADKKLVSRKFI